MNRFWVNLRRPLLQFKQSQVDRLQFGLLLVVTLLATCLTVPAVTLALSSTTYQVPQYDVPQGAGTVTSTNYQVQGVVTPMLGTLSSTTYVLDDGFPAITGGSISLNLDSNTAQLNLSPGSPATATTTITIATDAIAGYSLAIQKNQLLTHTDTSTTVDDVSGTIASPAVWSGTGFAFTASSGTSLEAKWLSGLAFAAIPIQIPTTFHTVATAINAPDATQVTYKIDTAASQKAGRYSAIVSFVATVAP